jgi:homoserine kinase
MPISFRSGPVRVRTPATSANLGPGFDALGLALALYDEVTAEIVDDRTTVEVVGEGAGVLPIGEDHLVVRSMRAAFHHLAGGAQPRGIRLRCVNRIPQARGLGSSSAAIVAGVRLTQALLHDADEGTTGKERALEIAGELEGHPDNAAPCILGGFTIAWLSAPEPSRAPEPQRRAPRPKAIALQPADGIEPVVFVPQTQGLTSAARAALPSHVPHRDAAFNAGRSALLVHALTREPSLLLEATDDRLHQGYRAPAMPATAALVTELRRAGIPAMVSGAGPAVLSLVMAESKWRLSGFGVSGGWVRHSLRFDLVGAAAVE